MVSKHLLHPGTSGLMSLNLVSPPVLLFMESFILGRLMLFAAYEINLVSYRCNQKALENFW